MTNQTHSTKTANPEREAMLRAMRERAARAAANARRPMALADARSFAPASDKRAR